MMSFENEQGFVQLAIEYELWEQMQANVSSLFPEEGCGLLGGTILAPNRYMAQKLYPIENTLHSQERFRMHPQQQLQAFDEIDKQSLALVAIYHSHPKGALSPSFTDIAECFYPDVIQLIWAKQPGVWKCKGFLFQPRKPRQVSIKVVHLRGKIK